MSTEEAINEIIQELEKRARLTDAASKLSGASQASQYARIRGKYSAYQHAAEIARELLERCQNANADE